MSLGVRGSAVLYLIFLWPNPKRLNSFDTETQIDSVVLTRCRRIIPLLARHSLCTSICSLVEHVTLKSSKDLLLYSRTASLARNCPVTQWPPPVNETINRESNQGIVNHPAAMLEVLRAPFSLPSPSRCPQNKEFPRRNHKVCWCILHLVDVVHRGELELRISRVLGRILHRNDQVVEQDL